MVSIASFKSSSIQHDVFVNYVLIWSEEKLNLKINK